MRPLRQHQVPAINEEPAYSGENPDAGTPASNPAPQSERMVTYCRNRLFGSTGKDYSTIPPGFLLRNLPADCPIIIALFQLLQFINEQQKMYDAGQNRLTLLEKLLEERVPEIDRLYREYEACHEETEQTFLFKGEPKKKEAAALLKFEDAVKELFREGGIKSEGKELTEAFRSWRMMLPETIGSLRREQTLLGQDMILYRTRFMKLKAEYDRLMGQMPPEELGAILGSDEKLASYRMVIDAAEVEV